MAPITARAKRSLTRPQPWDRTKWPSSTPPGWQLSSDGNNWQAPPDNWRYNGAFWFLVRDCEAFAKGDCARGNRCKRFHSTTTKSAGSATGSLGNSSTETLIIENVTKPEIGKEASIEITSVSGAESTKDGSEDNVEVEKMESSDAAFEAADGEDTEKPEKKEAQAQQEISIEEVAPHVDLLTKLRAVYGFNVLADYISQLQASDNISKLSTSPGAADLILASTQDFDYTNGIKIYHQWLIEQGPLPKESIFHDFSGQTDCCLSEIQELNDQENTCHHGLVLIDPSDQLCSAGRGALVRLREVHPGLAVVFVVNGKSVYEGLKPIAAKFPATLQLLTGRKYNRLQSIKNLLSETLQAKYKGKIQFEGGNDGKLATGYARSIHRLCKRNYDEDNLKEMIKVSLGETCKRHFDRLLESSDTDGEGGSFMLSIKDVFPDDKPTTGETVEKSEFEIDAEKTEERKTEHEHRKRFQVLQEHIDTKLPSLAKLAKSEHGSILVDWRQLNLKLADGRNWDYFHGVKSYYRALRAAGLITKESKYLMTKASSDCGCDATREETSEDEKSDDGDTKKDDDESDEESDKPTEADEQKKLAKRLNCITKIVENTMEGVLLVDTAESLCEVGIAALRLMHKERPGLIVVLDIRNDSMPEKVQSLAGDLCPFVLDIDEDHSKSKPSADLKGKVSALFIESVQKKYEGHMKFEGGAGGSLVQACVRRVVKKCKEDASEDDIDKEVKAQLSGIYDRHLQRHMDCTGDDIDTDFMLLTCGDLLGKEPDVTRYETDEWKELNKMIGMESVKSSIQALFDGLLLNYYREIHNQTVLQVGLSKIFLGPAGTGKTTVAKLYGKLLKTFGILSDGELLVKNASDFIGRYIGYSAHQTKEILEEAQGKVLLIDEAYMLDAKRNGSCRPCPFRQEAVDTLVGEVQNKPGDDICVIMCGYKTEMETFIRDANPGFQRRFPLADAFIFNDFTEEQLNGILDLKMEAQSLSTTPEGRATAMDCLRLAKQRPNFGNGGEIDNLLSRAMLNFQRRFGSTVAPEDRFEAAKNSVLLPQDFDPKYNRVQDADKKIGSEIDMIGMDAQKAVFSQLSTQAKAMKKFGRDPKPYMPFTLVFKGPPGTGKTSFARHIGRIYYEMGILASADVVEASTTDMIAGYVGQTAPKTRSLLESGLGKVLLIDEAYRLGGAEEGKNCFSREARDELVDCLTKPEFARKLVIVLAGYAGETETMLSKNPGLSSRFPMHVDFEPLPSSLCLGLLKKRIEEADIVADIDAADQEILACLDQLRAGKQWSNGRDVETMAAEMVRKSFEASAMVIEVDNEEELPSPTVTKELALQVMSKRLPKSSSIQRKAPFDIRKFQVAPKSNLSQEYK